MGGNKGSPALSMSELAQLETAGKYEGEQGTQMTGLIEVSATLIIRRKSYR